MKPKFVPSGTNMSISINKIIPIRLLNSWFVANDNKSLVLACCMTYSLVNICLSAAMHL